MFRSSLALAEKTLGQDSAQAINDERSLAELLIAQKKYDEAETLLKRALASTKNCLAKRVRKELRLEALAALYVQQNKRIWQILCSSNQGNRCRTARADLQFKTTLQPLWQALLKINP